MTASLAPGQSSQVQTALRRSTPEARVSARREPREPTPSGRALADPINPHSTDTHPAIRRPRGGPPRERTSRPGSCHARVTSRPRHSAVHVMSTSTSMSCTPHLRHITALSLSTSHNVTSHHTTSYKITSHHIISHHTFNITSSHSTSHDTTSPHITSHHITSRPESLGLRQRAPASPDGGRDAPLAAKQAACVAGSASRR